MDRKEVQLFRFVCSLRPHLSATDFKNTHSHDHANVNERVHIYTVLLKFMFWLWTMTFAHLKNIWPRMDWHWMDPTIWKALWSCLYWYDNSPIEEGCGDIGCLITLNCSYDCHWCRLCRGTWVDRQRPATSLYLVHLVFPELSPALAQTAFQHHGALSLLLVRPAASTPSLPYHFRRKKERCLSWTRIKGKGKEKRKSFDGSRTAPVESLQRQTCKDSCERQPLWSSQCNSVPLSVSKTHSLTEHFQAICLHLLLTNV